jgi:hypothetical protein
VLLTGAAKLVADAILDLGLEMDSMPSALQVPA